MSSTRKKLNRLFRAPSEASVDAFAPRDLERAPREFDAKGHQVQAAPALQSDAEVPRSTAASRTKTATQGGRAPTLHGEQNASLRPNASPPPSKAGAVQKERAHAMHTAPWAASAAFESWKQQRDTKHATVAVKKSSATLPKDTAPTSAAPCQETTTTPAQRIEQARRATVPPAHVHALDVRPSPHKTSMRAAQEFAAWKQHQPSPAPVSSTAKKSLPEDRVLRRAIRSREALLPEPARQYALLSVEQTTTNKEAHNKAPSTQRKDAASKKLLAVNHAQSTAKQSDNAASAATHNATRTMQMQQMATAAKTPAERLMWVSAHRVELANEHIVSSLYALGGTGLRAGHEARRLRMLAEALLALGKDESCLETLEALQKIVPHDAWTLLRLAEVCAKNAGTLEAGLRWCDELLRLHPWLSQTETVRAQIEAKLAALH